ncbi:MAG: aspartate dehydrogenase [Elusimicrobia bacterium RIFOXYA2_FULL_39_19]|nr:MAG: aspartate dehydrogenase [Elusimicrobia bacterium RIFOXYA2_FULL_39_19]
MKKIALIGCGTIGKEIALAIDKKNINATITAIYDVIPEKAEDLKNILKNNFPIITGTIKEAVGTCDLIVECASQNAVNEISKTAFPSKKDVFILSVGALIAYPQIMKSARRFNVKVLFPSGAIAGLDAVRAAKLSGIVSSTLTTRKPPVALGLNLKKEKIIFRGSAKDAIKKFPANINVAAALSICSIGPENTKVIIIADPKIKRNTHEIEVISKSGRILARTENMPSPDNPKTSYLASLSAIANLRELCQ